MAKTESGFTLIELVIVIVILGILAATAIPRFIDLQGDARQASIDGLAGAVRAASALAHAQQLVDGTSTGTAVTMEGQSIAMTFGYPTVGNIDDALSDYSGYSYDGSGQFDLDTAVANCTVTYAASASVGPPPTITANKGGC